MASILCVDPAGTSGNRLVAFPIDEYAERRISFVEFYTTDVDLGPGRLLFYRNACATIARGVGAIGYNVTIVGPADEVQVLLREFQKLIGYVEQAVLPLGIVATVSSFFQRLRWIVTGKW